MDVKKRPTSITVIAWLNIAGGWLSLVAIVAFYIITYYTRIEDPMLEGQRVFDDMSRLWTTMAVSGAIGVVSGIAILKGLNWGRLLYLCFFPITIVLSWLLYGFHLSHVLSYVLQIILYTVYFVFLTRPVASAFFARKNSEELKLKE